MEHKFHFDIVVCPVQAVTELESVNLKVNRGYQLVSDGPHYEAWTYMQNQARVTDAVRDKVLYVFRKLIETGAVVVDGDLSEASVKDALFAHARKSLPDMLVDVEAKANCIV